jgi:hypothetical protein
VIVELIVLACTGAFITRTVEILGALAAGNAGRYVGRSVMASVETTIASLPPELQDEWAEEWHAELTAALSKPITAWLFALGLRESALELENLSGRSGEGLSGSRGRSCGQAIHRSAHAVSLARARIVRAAQSAIQSQRGNAGSVDGTRARHSRRASGRNLAIGVVGVVSPAVANFITGLRPERNPKVGYLVRFDGQSNASLGVAMLADPGRALLVQLGLAADVCALLADHGAGGGNRRQARTTLAVRRLVAAACLRHGLSKIRPSASIAVALAAVAAANLGHVITSDPVGIGAFVLGALAGVNVKKGS